MGADVRQFTPRCRKCLNKHYLEDRALKTRHGFNTELVSLAVNSAIMKCNDCSYKWRTTAKYIHRLLIHY